MKGLSSGLCSRKRIVKHFRPQDLVFWVLLQQLLLEHETHRWGPACACPETGVTKYRIVKITRTFIASVEYIYCWRARERRLSFEKHKSKTMILCGRLLVFTVEKPRRRLQFTCCKSRANQLVEHSRGFFFFFGNPTKYYVYSASTGVSPSPPPPPGNRTWPYLISFFYWRKHSPRFPCL